MNNEEFDAQTALKNLQQLFQAQAELAEQQATANRLKEDELRVERDKAENHRRELDLQAQDMALKRETLNRAETRLQEVIQRYIQAEAKLITTDDSYGETVQRVIDRLKRIEDAVRDIEKGVLALLTRDGAGIQESRDAIRLRRQLEQVEDLITQHYDNLHALKERAARRGDDVPVALLNDIKREEEAIENLERKKDELETRLK